MGIPDKLKQRIEYVADYIGTETNDWLLIKPHLIRAFSSDTRKLFSLRHPCTKKQIPNNFDRMVMEFWKELTGIEPIIKEINLHPENWVHKKKGWALNGGKKNEQ